LPRTPSSEAL